MREEEAAVPRSCGCALTALDSDVSVCHDVTDQAVVTS